MPLPKHIEADLIAAPVAARLLGLLDGGEKASTVYTRCSEMKRNAGGQWLQVTMRGRSAFYSRRECLNLLARERSGEISIDRHGVVTLIGKAQAA